MKRIFGKKEKIATQKKIIDLCTGESTQGYDFFLSIDCNSWLKNRFIYSLIYFFLFNYVCKNYLTSMLLLSILDFNSFIIYYYYFFSCYFSNIKTFLFVFLGLYIYKYKVLLFTI